MQTVNKRSPLLSILGTATLCLTLSACSTHSKTEAGDHSHPHGHADKNSQQLPHSHNGYSKPGAPITLQHGSNKVDSLGETVAVTFTLATRRGLDAVSVSLNGENLGVAGSSLISVGDMAANSSQEITAYVSPSATGRQYLSVIITGQNNGHSTGRAFSIPIDVVGSQPTMKSNGKMTTGPGGENVISMPADES